MPTFGELLKLQNPALYEQFKGRRVIISKKAGQSARDREIKRMCIAYNEQGMSLCQVLNEAQKHFPEISQARIRQIWKG